MQKALTSSACGSVVEVAAGELFSVELEENPTTGYRWEFCADAGVEVVSSSYAASSGAGAGSGGRRLFLFKVTGGGEFRLRGKLLRSWLGEGSAIQQCEITVRSAG
ncbi:MAG TPA: protease inhibitor I42 family protein [Acidobacteriaceae bacterium]|nr:protease inhibitor I42 family protein [Acidobacteriaceae bacterium]